MHGQAPVMDNELSGDIVTHVTGQINGRADKILGYGGPFYALVGLLDLFKGRNRDRLALIEPVATGRMSKTGGDGVHVDVVIPQFPGHGPRKGHDRTFGLFPSPVRRDFHAVNPVGLSNVRDLSSR